LIKRWNYTIISLESCRSISVDFKWGIQIKKKIMTEISEPETSKHRTKNILFVTAAIIFATVLGTVLEGTI